MRALHQHPIARACAHQHREFVSTEPGDQIAIAHFARQPCAHLAEQGISHSVPLRVVDCLEIVEIEIEQGHLARAAGRGQRRAQFAVKAIAVGKPGELVEMGHVLDLLFDHPRLGHVPPDAGDPCAGLRSCRERPPALFARHGQRNHQIAKRGTIGQQAGKPVTRFPRVEQLQQAAASKPLRINSGDLRQPG